MGSKITQLTEDTSPSGDDVMEIVNDPTGTPASRKVKVLNLLKRLFLGDGTQLTITTVADGEFLKRSGANIQGASPGGGGLGDVVGPGSSTDNALARFDSTTGKLIQNSTVTLDDTGAITVPEMAAPSTPAANKVAVYAKSDGKLYIKDDAGTETDLTATGSGAEVGANSDITSMDGLTGAIENPTKIIFPEGAAASTPGANKVALYAKSDGLLYSKDDAGAETLISGGSGSGSIAPLVIESANVVAQRNGASAQSFMIYGTFTDASNYERLFVGRDGSNFVIRAEALGTGAQQQLQLRYGASRILAYDGGTFFPDSNNVTALGTGSNRWSTIRTVSLMAQSEVQFEGQAALKDAGNVNGGVTRFIAVGGNPGTWAAGVQAESLGSSNLNNYTYTSNAHMQRWSSGAAIDVTGIVRGQVDGQTHLIVNVGSNNITLKHEDANSTAGNRFLNSTGADIVLSANQAADVIYDATSARWRVFKRN